MGIDPRTAIWTAEISLWDIVNDVEVIVRVASGAGFTIGGVPAVTAGVRMVLDDPIATTRSMFDSHRTTGRGITSVGNLVLINNYGTLDQYRTYAVDGRSVEFRMVPIGGEYNTDAEDAGSYTMEGAVMGAMVWTIALRGWQRSLEVPIQTTVFAGNNTPPDGLEGTADLAGKPKPIVYGSPRNVPLQIVNPQKLIYQVADKQLAAIDAVYDAGVPLVSGASNWGSVTNGMGATTVRGVAADLAGAVLAVGDGGKIERSTNYGVSFSTVTPPTANDLYCVAWFPAASLWIVAGAAGTLFTSATGATGTWTSRTSQFGASRINAITVSDTTALIVGVAGKASTSTNGTTWTAQTTGTGGDLVSCAYRLTSVGRRFVAHTTISYLSWSPDGVTWTSASSHAGFVTDSRLFRGIAGGSTAFVMVGESGAIAWSENGDSWSLTLGTTAMGSNVITSVAANADGMFIAASQTTGGATFVGVSPDHGVTWRLQKASSTAARNFACFTGTTWVYVGSSGSIEVSSGTKTYGSLADLQDDSLAPDPGNYAVRFDSTGTYIRLGSPRVGVITCDPVEGSSTVGQIFRSVIGTRVPGVGVANLLLQSATFDNATWSKTNITSTANNIANPIDAAVTADKMAATATAATAVTQSATVPTPAPAAFTYSCYIKKGTSATTANGFKIRNSTTATDLLVGTVNLDTGATTITGGSGRFHATPVKGNAGWYRVVLTITSGFSAGNSLIVSAAFTGGSYTAGDFSYLYGAQLEGRAAVSSYIPTTAATAIGGDWDESDIATLDAAFPAPLGIFIPDGDRLTCADVIDRLAVSARAGWFTDAQGIVRIKRLAAPSGSPFTTIQESQMEGMTGVGAADGGLPRSRTVIRYSLNYQPMSGTEIAGDIEGAARSLLEQEWLEAATAFDANVLEDHPLATFTPEETLISSQSDAATEATSRQTLFGVDRYWFDVPVRLDPTTFLIELGDVVSLASTRYGMGAGTLANVLGVDPRPADGQVILSVWL